MPSYNERLIAHLRLCPCCFCEAQTVSKPEDGIPDGAVHETAFLCGARILVMDVGDYNVSTGCPYPADDKLQDFRRDLLDGIAEPEGEDIREGEDDQP